MLDSVKQMTTEEDCHETQVQRLWRWVKKGGEELDYNSPHDQMLEGFKKEFAPILEHIQWELMCFGYSDKEANKKISEVISEILDEIEY